MLCMLQLGWDGGEDDGESLVPRGGDLEEEEYVARQTKQIQKLRRSKYLVRA